jgi:hypothetical protein
MAISELMTPGLLALRGSYNLVSIYIWRSSSENIQWYYSAPNPRMYGLERDMLVAVPVSRDHLTPAVPLSFTIT